MKIEKILLALAFITTSLILPIENIKADIITCPSIYYPFSNADGEVVVDVMPDNYDSTTWGTATQSSGGILGDTAEFDGNGYFSPDDSYVLNNIFKGGDWTVSMWVYTESTNARIPLSFSGGQYIYIQSNGNINVEIGGSLNSGSGVFETSQWNNITIVHNGASSKLFYNGTEVDSGTLSGVTGNYVEFGVLAHAQYSFGWLGKIDEVGIWNSALTDTEITEINNGGSPIALDVQCGSEEPILGCTDPMANNYNPSATENDGSCTYTTNTTYTSTSTCTLSNPVNYLGETVSTSTVPFAFASSTCIITSPMTNIDPIIWGIATLIFLFAFAIINWLIKRK